MKKIIAVIDPNAPADIQSVLRDATQDHFDSANSAMEYLNGLSSVRDSVAAIYSTEQLIDGSGIDFLIRAADVDSDYDSLQTIIVGDQAAQTVQNIAIKRGITRWISDLDDLRTDLNVTVNDALEASFLEEVMSDRDVNIGSDEALSIVDEASKLSLDDDNIDDFATTELLDGLDLDDDDDDIFDQTETHSLSASTAIIDATLHDDDGIQMASIDDQDSTAFAQELLDEDEALSIAEESIRESSEALLNENDASIPDQGSDDTDELIELSGHSDDGIGDDADLESLESELFGDTEADELMLSGANIDESDEIIGADTDAESISDEDLEALQALMDAETNGSEESSASFTDTISDVKDVVGDQIEEIADSIEDTIETTVLDADDDSAESISDADLESLQASVMVEGEENAAEEGAGDEDETELLREFEALMESGEFDELAAMVDAEEADSFEDSSVALDSNTASAATNEPTATTSHDDQDFTYDNIDMEDNTYGNLAALVREVSGGKDHELDLPDATTKDIQKMINTRVQDAILDHGTVMLMASKDFTRKYGSQLELELIRHINQLEQRIAELESRLN